MKTTIEIDDDLLTVAKAAAVRRRTTLKAILEHALRREIYPSGRTKYGEQTEPAFELNEDGIPQLKRTGKGTVTSKMVYELMEEEGV